MFSVTFSSTVNIAGQDPSEKVSKMSSQLVPFKRSMTFDPPKKEKVRKMKVSVSASSPLPVHSEGLPCPPLTWDISLPNLSFTVLN